MKNNEQNEEKNRAILSLYIQTKFASKQKFSEVKFISLIYYIYICTLNVEKKNSSNCFQTLANPLYIYSGYYLLNAVYVSECFKIRN